MRLPAREDGTTAATVADHGGMQIHIEASALPGRDCGPDSDFPGYANIHVGVQRKDRPGELLDPHPGDAPSASWVLDCTARATADGIEVSGPYVQNRLGGRFVYLSWGTVDEAGVFTMFRRAKLMFDDIDPAVLEAAARTGHLTGRLGLTDPKGQPLCARVRPPHITWSATGEADRA
ncbi:hypothetical protein SGR_5057 [Streptomyces griseus subsp. griseus NBRC 13350]|uniref:Monooxygenase n=2 Tax=Streptomyces TaxID=1883 RepID=B1VYA1_STRGG|nr:hypothetical protein SGR_5057 [Streptomyces griseus subsp. griseus NBRC 13350]SEE60633.1 hypothetical protein SAMN04490359_4424 [Streptomyces griseus]SQA25929.1 putative monooxygenase [Streptomyces griseus]